MVCFDMALNIEENKTLVRRENPNSKYLAGKDAEMLMEAKKSISKEEFSKMMKQNLMGGIQG